MDVRGGIGQAGTAGLAVLVCFLVAGCGTSGGSSSPSAAPLNPALLPTVTTHASATKKSAPPAGLSRPAVAFRLRVNELCRATNSFVVALPRDTTATAFRYDMIRMLTEEPRWAAELEAITPPRADASKYTQLLRVNAEQIVVLRDELIEASQGNLRAVRRLVHELGAISRRYNRLSNAMGLSTCAKNVAPASSRKPPSLQQAASLAQTSLTIPGAPGYTTFTGPDGEALPVGRPWGRSCRPIRFAFGKGVPGWVQTQARQVITRARGQGIDVTVEGSNYSWSSSSLYYRPGQSWKTTAEVGIFASNGLPPVLTNGHLEHINLAWDARQDPDGHNEDLTTAQGILQMRVLTGQPQTVRRSIRQLIAMTQGIMATTQHDSAIAQGTMIDQFTPADIAAMKRMSGCN